ncbi:hypothetical protein EDD16DRAFT_1547355 [Pisolithus croceorrhizus]|nr:hypothetical protein EDD16DRAFT_1547355 [Pisolithus croceorrhizus]KAI6133922.1 hypothetical protein EV401DRAFT_1910352 [Pisolithus croceorrhizus]KAI6162867.1 hypothetical protein EDD17DRAFT_1573025 [Pisolithus thermaeus]
MTSTVNLKYLTSLTNDMRSRMYDYVVDYVVYAVDFSRGNLFPLRKCCPPSRLPEYALFKDFVIRVIEQSRVSVYGVAVALVYVNRLKKQKEFGYEAAVYERLFTGALLLSQSHISKYRPHTGCDWAVVNLILNQAEIRELELHFLETLGHDLDVADYELLEHELAITRIICSLHVPRICPHHDNSRPVRAKFCPPHHCTASDRVLPVLEKHANVGGPRRRTPCRSYLRALFSRDARLLRII